MTDQEFYNDLETGKQTYIRRIEEQRITGMVYQLKKKRGAEKPYELVRLSDGQTVDASQDVLSFLWAAIWKGK